MATCTVCGFVSLGMTAFCQNDSILSSGQDAVMATAPRRSRLVDGRWWSAPVCTMRSRLVHGRARRVMSRRSRFVHGRARRADNKVEVAELVAGEASGDRPLVAAVERLTAGHRLDQHQVRR